MIFEPLGLSSTVMAEFGLAASIIAAIQISDAVVERAFNYGKAIKDAKQDMETLQRDVDGLRLVLTKLRDLAQKASNTKSSESLNLWPTLVSLQGKDSPLDACQSALHDLLPDLSPVKWRDKIKARLTWPHLQKKINAKLNTIVRQKEHLIQCLNLEQMVQIRSMSQSVSRAEDDKIIRWLVSTDSTVNYVAAIDSHGAKTGSWLLNDPRYQTWKRDSNPYRLWLYGPSGCGKTVLCSVVIQDILKDLSNNAHNLIAYYFFDMTNRAKQDVISLLRSLIGQICIKLPELPDCVLNLYKHYGHGEPPRYALNDAFHTILATVKRAYIVVDALDECSEQRELFAVLKRIQSIKSADNRLLFTSHDQSSIRDSLDGLIDDSIGVRGKSHDLDIRSYVHQCLTKEGTLDRWKDHQIRPQIEKKLCDGAQGS